MPTLERQAKLRQRRNAALLFEEARTANRGEPVDISPVTDAIRRDLGAGSPDDAIRAPDLPSDLPEQRLAREAARRLLQRTPAEADPLTALDDEVAYFGRVVRESRPSAERPRSLGTFLRERGFDPASPDRGAIDAIVGTTAGRGRAVYRQGGFRDFDDAAASAHGRVTSTTAT